MRHVEIDSTPWSPCSFDSSHECRAVQTLQHQSEALVYRVDLAQQNATPTPVETIPEESVFWIGQSERGDDVVLGRGRWLTTFWADAAHYRQSGDPYYDFATEQDRCTIEYRRQSDFGVRSAAIQAQDACFYRSFNYPSLGGTGTIAPDVAPNLGGVRSQSGTSREAISVPKPMFGSAGSPMVAFTP